MPSSTTDVRILGYSLAALMGSYPGRVVAVVFTERPGSAGCRLDGKGLCTVFGATAQLSVAIARAHAREGEGNMYSGRLGVPS